MSVTIGILPLPESVEKVKGFVDQGFKALKIKGGIDVEADIEKIVRIRQTVGDHNQEVTRGSRPVVGFYGIVYVINGHETTVPHRIC